MASRVLWIDDDYYILSGLGSLLEETIPGLDIIKADSVSRAKAAFDDTLVDLLLFDMVLMEDPVHAALGRRAGMALARFAFDQGVRRFVTYTVLGPREVKRSWQTLREGHPDIDGSLFEYCSKNLDSATQVAERVRKLLETEVASNGR